MKFERQTLIALSFFMMTAPVAAGDDGFFPPTGADAATEAKTQRVIADHISRGTVEQISPETVTIGRGGVSCEQGVVRQEEDSVLDGDIEITLIRPTQICIDE